MFKIDEDYKTKSIKLTINEQLELLQDSKKNLNMIIDAELLASAVEDKLTEFGLYLDLDIYSDLNNDLEDLIEIFISKATAMIIKELKDSKIIGDK